MSGLDDNGVVVAARVEGDTKASTQDMPTMAIMAVALHKL